MIQQEKCGIHIYIAVYFLLLFKVGFYFIEQSNMITAPLYFALLLYIAIRYYKGLVRTEKTVVFVALSLFVLMNMTNLVCGLPAINEFINTIINIITALLFVFIIPKNKFIKAFCDIIFWIGIASIIAWVAMTFIPQIFRFFPSLVNTSNRVGYFCGLTIVSDFRGASAQRTQGLFWEPGAYQSLVVVAMLLEKYYYSPPKKLLRIIINSIAVFLSFSTTGYIALILVWMILLSKDEKHFHAIRTGLLVLLVGYLYLTFGTNLSGQLWYTLSFKIEGMLNYKTATNYSITARAGSVIEPLKLFLSNPILGIGENGYRQVAETVGLATCTPVNYICKYGLLFAGMNFYGFYKFIRTKDMRLPELLFVIGTLLVTFFSETFFMNPILLVFMFYGYKREVIVERHVIEGANSYEYKRQSIRI
ncbi:MAG: hypothetical protein E7294_04695 [Lachnospiraceae bacterium]|jgi:hypothetical protein|nr:hypothetical protein [Lachnospiraceae bacterium]